MYFVLGLLVFIIVLGVIVIIHEGGHFLAAKKAGILCHEFSVGMGPKIASTKKGETVYSIRAIPIGGYVAMAGEEVNDDCLKGITKLKLVIENDRVVKLITDEKILQYKDLPTYELLSHDLIGTSKASPDELYVKVKLNDEVSTFIVSRDCMLCYKKNEEIQIAPYDRAFTNKPLINRFLSVFAGPFMNFVLAVIVFFVAGCIYGYADTSSTKVVSVSGSSLAAGIEDNDKLLSIGDVKLTDWNSISDAMNGKKFASLLDSTGALSVKYFDVSENIEKTVKVYPRIYAYSIEMILAAPVNNVSKVIVGDYGSVMEETKAYKAGLRADDEIYKIDNSPINNVKDFVQYMSSIESSKDIKIYVTRDGAKIAEPFTVNTYSEAMLDTQELPTIEGLLGISTGTTKNIDKLIYMPFVQTGKASIQIFKTLGLFFKKNAGVKLTDLSGPVGIFSLFTQLVQGENAFYNVLYWTGLLSVNIGLINLLPLPALDGGRLAFIIYEGVTKKRPSPKVENTIHTIGFMLLMGLFVVIAISDIIKCF